MCVCVIVINVLQPTLTPSVGRIISSHPNNTSCCFAWVNFASVILQISLFCLSISSNSQHLLFSFHLWTVVSIETLDNKSCNSIWTHDRGRLLDDKAIFKLLISLRDTIKKNCCISFELILAKQSCWAVLQHFLPGRNEYVFCNLIIWWSVDKNMETLVMCF